MNCAFIYHKQLPVEGVFIEVFSFDDIVAVISRLLTFIQDKTEGKVKRSGL